MMMTKTTNNKTREQRVKEFNEAAGSLPFNDGGFLLPQVNCFSEELVEFNEALAKYVADPTNKVLREEMIKEWADVQVTLSNFAWFFSFDGEEAFSRVADNNMSKVVDGKVVRRESDGKILKPEGYKPVSMEGL